MEKVHIGGARYGLHNIGDESILLSIINSFKEYNLSVSSYGSEWINKIDRNIEKRNFFVDYSKPKLGLFINPKKEVFSNFRMLNNEKIFFKSKDIYICGGGTILSDCPWYSLRTVQIAGAAGIAVYLWGVGMADVDDLETRKYIKKVLNQKYVKYVYTRDEYVKERLIQVGVDRNKLGVSYDPAIMLTGKMDYEKYLSYKELHLYQNGKPNIVFSLSGETDVILRTPIKEIENAIKEIQKRYDSNIFIVPTGCGAHCKDIEFANTIVSKLNNPRIVAIRNEFSPEDLIGFLKNVQVIVSSRLHLNIFGACAGTPSVGLVRNSKIVDFAKLVQTPYLELDKLNSSQIEIMVGEVLKNRSEYQSNMQLAVNRMRKQYTDALLEIKERINNTF